MQDAEVIPQEISALGHRLEDVEKRLDAVEKVRGHWDAVYEALRRKDTSQEGN